MSEVVFTTREVNKEKRRRRILDEARQIIATSGYDALNTRDLAAAAEITTPTLYNLVGTKEEILTTLTFEALDGLVATMSHIEDCDVLHYFEALIFESMKLVEADEDFYRGTLLAMYRLSASQKPDNPEYQFGLRGAEVAAHGCRIGQKQGLLLGNLSAEAFGTQMYTLYAAPWREWAYRRMSVQEFRHQALQGWYICLCGDASPEFQSILHKRLRALRIEDTRITKRKRKRA